jgi:hypothetical protein
MGRFDKKKEPRLNEVKAVLQRLQGFPEDEKPALEPLEEGRPQRAGALIVVISVVLIVAVLGAAYTFTTLTTTDVGSAPPKVAGDPKVAADPKVAGDRTTQPVDSEALKAVLETARSLMAKGQVRAAREQLLALARKGSPDAAWDVARSYDPNVLATIPQADAAPDIPEATRWYRTWYASAVKEGMVANSVSIERIIGAMQR